MKGLTEQATSFYLEFQRLKDQVRIIILIQRIMLLSRMINKKLLTYYYCLALTIMISHLRDLESACHGLYV